MSLVRAAVALISIIDFHKAQSLCRRCVTGFPAVLCLYDLCDLFGFDLTIADLKKGADDDPDHVLQETIAVNIKTDIGSALLNAQYIHDTHRGFFHF